jgi:hypothetical protein
VFNTELRVPIFRYLVNRPIRSDFFHNFQVAGFRRRGCGLDRPRPLFRGEYLQPAVVIHRNPLTITIDSQREPIVVAMASVCAPAYWATFVRADWAWGIDDGVMLQPSVPLLLELGHLMIMGPQVVVHPGWCDRSWPAGC